MKGRLGRQKNLKLYFRHGPQPSGGAGATCGTGQSAEAAELDALQGDFISRQPLCLERCWGLLWLCLSPPTLVAPWL